MENYVKIQNKKIAYLLIKIFKGIQGIRQKIRPVLHHPFTPPETTYNELICITGFGYSGSGTVVDFLSEFNTTTVYGGYDSDSGGPLSKKSTKKSVEIDFLRMSIGVYALENIIESSNEYLKHTMMSLFITHSEYYYRSGNFYNDYYMELTRDFINKIIEYKTISHYCGREFSPDLSFFNYSYGDYKNLESPLIANFANEHYLYFLKKLTKDQYITIASQYIYKLLKSINSKQYLVLDQFISDGNPDLEYHMKYCGPLKEICIYRDPRDVYTYGILDNVSWIPRDPHDFIKWYLRKVIPYLSYQHKDYLILRFEDMVLNYESSSRKIMDLIGLKSENHALKYKYFDPNISKKNIGIYKICNDKVAISVIEKELSQYCYYQ